MRYGSVVVAAAIALHGLAAPAEAKIKGKELRYSADGVKMRGYLVTPTGKKKARPAVLVVHEWWGHNAYARRRAKMLARLGYVALAVDMYGDGKTADHPKDAKKFASAVFGDLDGAQRRFAEALKVLRAQPGVDPERVAAIGYCFGGGIVLHMARRGIDLRGVASFHGSLATKKPAERGKVKAKLLVLNGAADPMAPAEQVAAFEREMKAAGVDLKLVSYPGAKHAFTNPAADRLGRRFKIPIAYNASADRKSWAELRRFLAGIF